MKKYFVSLIMLTSITAANVNAETYLYSGKNYTAANAPYTLSMRVTGSITTSSPIPPNSSKFDIRDIATSWSFFDGVHTITNADGEFHPVFSPKFTTDGSGEILSADAWVNFGTTASAKGQTEQYIATMAFGLPAGFDHGVQLAQCNAISEFPADSNEFVCTSYLFGPRGRVEGAPGPWTIDQPVREVKDLPLPSGATGGISFTTDDPGCTFDTKPKFVTVDSVGSTPPKSIAAIDGLIEFSINSCADGATVTVRVDYGSTLSTNAEYWKVGDPWYKLDATVIGRVIEFSITDGGLGDDDGVKEPNGRIIDPGGAVIADVFSDGFESE